MGEGCESNDSNVDSVTERDGLIWRARDKRGGEVWMTREWGGRAAVATRTNKGFKGRRKRAAIERVVYSEFDQRGVKKEFPLV